jgi:hypothetical protein
LVTRRERIDDFIHKGSPPNNQPLQILCEDHVGTYVIPFPCLWMACGKTQKPEDASKLRWLVGGLLTKLSAKLLDFGLMFCLGAALQIRRR